MGSWLRSLRRTQEAKSRGSICNERVDCREYLEEQGMLLW